MSKRKFKIGDIVCVGGTRDDCFLFIPSRYLGRKGVVEAYTGKAEHGEYIYGVHMPDRKNLLEVYEIDLKKINVAK